MNPGLNCNYLQIGQSVCVSQKVVVVQTYRPLRKVYNCQNIYTVIQNSDSCGTICERYKITSESFYRLNPSVDCNDIRLGDEICVPSIQQYPAHAFTASCGASYLVRLGDTCNTICDRYKIQLQDFYVLNPSVHCPLLRAGENICVSKQTIEYKYVDCKSYYVVKSGNSCENIARVYHLEYDRFIELNRQVSCSRLVPGQSVCISGQWY